MSAIKTANEAAHEVCRILGIDNRHVRGVTIDLAAGSVAVARVEFVLTREQWEQLGKSNEGDPE